MFKLSFEVKSLRRLIVGAVLLVIWLILLVLSFWTAWGALYIDHVARAFQVFLGIGILLLIVGLAGFGYLIRGSIKIEKTEK